MFSLLSTDSAECAIAGVVDAAVEVVDDADVGGAIEVGVAAELADVGVAPDVGSWADDPPPPLGGDDDDEAVTGATANLLRLDSTTSGITASISDSDSIIRSEPSCVNGVHY